MADFSEMENYVKLRICDFSNGAEVDREKFDIRNIPGIIDWIQKNI